MQQSIVPSRATSCAEGHPATGAHVPLSQVNAQRTQGQVFWLAPPAPALSCWCYVGIIEGLCYQAF